MKTHRRDAGFSLAAIVFFATITSIFIAAAVPVYQLQAKRELEEELIFRGGEYTRAIQKYRNHFGLYPTSVDQLVSTNGLRFLRRAYKDPITGKDFRFLTINPDGSLNGSKVFQQNTQSMFGNMARFGNSTSGQQPFGSTSANQTPPSTQTQNPQQPGGFGTGGGISSPGGFGAQPAGLQNAQLQQPQQPGGFGTGGGISSPGGFGAQPAGPQNAQLQQPQQTQPGFANSGASSSPFGSVSNPFGNSTGGFGSRGVTSGGIVGVASDSDKSSVKIYNNRQKYDEWEFVALFNQQGQVGQPGQVGQRGQVGQPGQNPFGAPSQNPAANPAQAPFQTPSPGGTPGSPFGPGQGTPTQNPFGTGIPAQNPFAPSQGMPTQNPFGTPNTPTIPFPK